MTAGARRSGTWVMTLRAAARRRGVGWHKINALVRAWAGIVAERRRSERCRVLLVDETSMRRQHRYVTVIVNADTGRTLAMVPHRNSAALSAFLAQQGHRWRKGVKWPSPTSHAPIRPPSTPASSTPATCLPGSKSSDGSPPGSPRCAETSSALHQHSQLPSPRPPRDIITPTGASSPSSHNFAQRPEPQPGRCPRPASARPHGPCEPPAPECDVPASSWSSSHPWGLRPTTRGLRSWTHLTSTEPSA